MKCENLSKAYENTPVLCDFTQVFLPGITCVMGPSGVGKTTLLRLLAGLEQPDSGTITGPEVGAVAMAFQEPRLLPHLTALDNVRFALGRAYDQVQAVALLRTLGLGEALDKPVSTYSGGMARRVSLARALLSPHQVLLLDEPFAGLDEDLVALARDLVVQDGGQATVIVVTHDSDDALALGGTLVKL